MTAQLFSPKKEQILNEKKTLKGKLNTLENNQKCWVEPMNNWLNTLDSICKIVENGDYAKKKELALEIFGLNLFFEQQNPNSKRLQRSRRGRRKWASCPLSRGPFSFIIRALLGDKKVAR